MKDIKLSNLLCFVLFACLTFASCSKEDSITDTEKETEIDLSATYELNNRSITTDAYAAFCSDNGKELLNVSNNQDLLAGFPFNSDDLQVGDFFFQYVIDGEDIAYAIGGSVFGEELGFFSVQALFDASSTYEISSNDGSVVSGEYSGTYLAFDDNQELFTLPYSLTFNAEIVEVAAFCD